MEAGSRRGEALAGSNGGNFSSGRSRSAMLCSRSRLIGGGRRKTYSCARSSCMHSSEKIGSPTPASISSRTAAPRRRFRSSSSILTSRFAASSSSMYRSLLRVTRKACAETQLVAGEELAGAQLDDFAQEDEALRAPCSPGRSRRSGGGSAAPAGSRPGARRSGCRDCAGRRRC